MGGTGLCSLDVYKLFVCVAGSTVPLCGRQAELGRAFVLHCQAAGVRLLGIP